MTERPTFPQCATLWEAPRLDLTAVALVILDRYATLFDDDLVERARQRFTDHGFVL